MRSDTDVAVIGAGPYGLAVAAHLRDSRIPFRIFGKPMDSWISNMPAGMYLKSEGFASNIGDPHDAYTLERFCELEDRSYSAFGDPVSLETFVAYGLWFQRTVVPDVEEETVEFVGRNSNGFELALSGGESFHARRVVVATGHCRFRYTPVELEGLPERLVTHSADHRRFDGFAGKSVGVVGAGQSALETAALLLEHGASPSLIIRRPRVAWNEEPEEVDRSLLRRIRRPVAGLGPGWTIWMYSNAPRAFHAFSEDRRIRIVSGTFGPSGAWWLRSRVEQRVPVLLNHRVTDAVANNGHVTLSLAPNGHAQQEASFDHVIAATGYRVDTDRLTFLASELRNCRRVERAPVLSSSFESSVRGLYFIGLPAANSFGPVMRFVFGTRYAARTLCRRLRRSA
jgi:FAD-dependent urate hydroxylase